MLAALLAGLVVLSAFPGLAQELEPRAYSVSPVGSNALILSYVRLRGGIVFDPSLEITNVDARINSAIAGYFRSIDFFGRSGNITLVAPYGWGTLNGTVAGEAAQVTRSGLSDSRVRFAVNLKGAPAMNLKEFANYRQKTNIGASVVVQMPTGQYDPARLINLGTNRWSFKPEIGLSHAINRRWILDLYGGAWFFTADKDFQGAGRTQKPVGAVQTHISYNIKPRLWAAFDATFYSGGRVTVGGLPAKKLLRNARYGGTVSVPLTRRQSFKFSINTGAFAPIGADFDSISVAYQYIWGAGL